jgi:hypothetical protein
MAACGLDRAGEMFVAGPVASAPKGAADADAGDSDSTGSFAANDPDAGDSGNTSGPIGARGVAEADSGSNATSAEASARDASDEDGPVDTDATSVCARLIACCPRLLAPPLAIGCIASAMQDGGESACEATLSSLVDAGVCP